MMASLTSLSYASIDHWAALIVAEGKDALLVKANIKEAYRMVPGTQKIKQLLCVTSIGNLTHLSAILAATSTIIP